MNLESIVNFAASPATWTIYFLIIVGFLFASIWKFHFTRDTWKDFFRFMAGVGGFLAGLGFGFQIIGKNLSIAFNLSYTVESVINAIFIVIYIILLWRLGKSLLDKKGWEWLGAIIILFFIGCIINAIVTGGRYLPFVGWLIG